MPIFEYSHVNAPSVCSAKDIEDQITVLTVPENAEAVVGLY